MDDELIGRMRRLRTEEVSPSDKLLVKVSVDTTHEDFAEVERTCFPKLEELTAQVQVALKEFFDTTGAPSNCHVVAATVLWVATQICMSAMDGISTDDLVRIDGVDDEAEKRAEFVRGVKTDWRSSVMLNVFQELLAGYRRSQSEAGLLPADLKASIARAAAELRGKAN